MATRAWLLSPAPDSRMQARCGRWFRAWLGFRRNKLAMTGLGIVVLLVLMAIFAPLIAGSTSHYPAGAGGPAAAGQLAASVRHR